MFNFLKKKKKLTNILVKIEFIERKSGGGTTSHLIFSNTSDSRYKSINIDIKELNEIECKKLILKLISDLYDLKHINDLDIVNESTFPFKFKITFRYMSFYFQYHFQFIQSENIDSQEINNFLSKNLTHPSQRMRDLIKELIY